MNPSIPLTCAGLFLIGSAVAQVPPPNPIDVTLFGATPNDPTDDDGPAIRDAVFFALNAGSATYPAVEVLLPPGTYHAAPIDVDAFRTVILGTSLTLNYEPQLTISGYGATLSVTEPHASAIVLWDMKDAVLRGLTITHETLPFTEGTVTKTHTNSTGAVWAVEVTIDPGLPAPDGVMFDPNHPSNHSRYDGLHINADVIGPGGNFRKDRHSYNVPTRVHWLSPGRYEYRLLHPFPAGTAVGDRFFHTARNGKDSAIGLLMSEDTVLQDLTIHAANTFVVGGTRSNMTMDGCVVSPDPRFPNLTITAGADMMHFQAGRGRNEITNCSFDGCNDDLANFHADAISVQSTTPSGSVTCTPWPADVLMGDVLEVRRGSGIGTAVGDAVVLSVSTASNGAHTFTYSGLSTPIAAGDWFFNRSEGNPNSLFDNVTWTRHRGAIQVKGTGTEIRNCTMIGNTGGLLIETAGPSSWGEGPTCVDLLVTNTLFRDCALSRSGNAWGYGCIYAHEATNLVFNSVTIEDTFRPGLHFDNVQGIDFLNCTWNNVGVTQPEAQLTFLNGCTGQIVGCSVNGAISAGGRYFESLPLLITRVGNNF